MNDFMYQGQIMKFIAPEPDPKNVCNLCGGNVGKDNLIQGQAANICFDCSDLAKQLADEKRKEIAEKEIKEIVRLIEGYSVKTDSADIASLLHQAGYRKVE
ncbi:MULTISPECIES: hypothetical protein [Providencia]|uniref:hypothetical protein n=1 Tax=Providencia TaxID=586 RepID=UPI00155E2715|nr:hypothetical protein [Providencia sp. PROV247]QKG44931.1 hypothetical protein HRD55_10215 [Providencia rettgeri]QNN35064.1 hypothetical protein H9X60_10220 [Providencia rettgeri]